MRQIMVFLFSPGQILHGVVTELDAQGDHSVAQDAPSHMAGKNETSRLVAFC